MRQKKQPNAKGIGWTPPKQFLSFFLASSDDAFKRKHPIGYGFLVILGLTALLLPAVLFSLWAVPEGDWAMLGFFGGMVFGTGLFNLVAIIIKQYLGHWVTLLSFAIGSLMMLLSWLLSHGML